MNTKYSIFNVKKENHPKLSQLCSYRSFSLGLKNKFETTVVNEPSVFEPLKFYCRNTMRKIACLPAAIISRNVYSCLHLRSREFGSMKDSEGV